MMFRPGARGISRYRAALLGKISKLIFRSLRCSSEPRFLVFASNIRFDCINIVSVCNIMTGIRNCD